MALNEYPFRLTHISGVTDEQYRELFQRYDEAFVVEENPSGDNRHFHGIVRTAVKHETFGKSLGAWCTQMGGPPSANGERRYAARRWRINYVYLAKGPEAISDVKRTGYPGVRKPPIVFYQKWTFPLDVDWKACHTAWWDDAKERLLLKQKVVQEAGKSVVKRGYDALKEVKDLTRLDIARWVTDDMKERKKPANPSLSRAQVRAIAILTDKGEEKAWLDEITSW